MKQNKPFAFYSFLVFLLYVVYYFFSFDMKGNRGPDMIKPNYQFEVDVDFNSNEFPQLEQCNGPQYF